MWIVLKSNQTLQIAECASRQAKFEKEGGRQTKKNFENGIGRYGNTILNI